MSVKIYVDHVLVETPESVWVNLDTSGPRWAFGGPSSEQLEKRLSKDIVKFATEWLLENMPTKSLESVKSMSCPEEISIMTIRSPELTKEVENLKQAYTEKYQSVLTAIDEMNGIVNNLQTTDVGRRYFGIKDTTDKILWHMNNITPEKTLKDY